MEMLSIKLRTCSAENLVVFLVQRSLKAERLWEGLQVQLSGVSVGIVSVEEDPKKAGTSRK